MNHKKWRQSQTVSLPRECFQFWLQQQHLLAKSVSTAAQPQHTLCSPDPSDQSCTADLRLLSFFILLCLASPPLPPPSLLAACPSSPFSALSLLICLEMGSCLYRQAQSQSTDLWKYFSFQLKICFKAFFFLPVNVQYGFEFSVET